MESDSTPGVFDGMTDDAIVAQSTQWAREDSAADAAAEMASLRAQMGDRNSDYWKGPEADKLQARYRELLTGGRLSSDPDTRLNQVMASNAQAEEQAEADRLHLPAHDYQLPRELAQDELAQSFASLAGAAGLPADLVTDVVSSQFHGGELQRDDSDRDAGLAELRSIWGSATEQNIATIRRYVANNLPPHLSDALMAPARRSDGRALVNDPAFLTQILGMARRGAQLATGDLAEIRRLMGTQAYRSDPSAQIRAQYLIRQQRRGGR